VGTFDREGGTATSRSPRGVGAPVSICTAHIRLIPQVDRSERERERPDLLLLILLQPTRRPEMDFLAGHGNGRLRAGRLVVR
jgi:hypothetical protein